MCFISISNLYTYLLKSGRPQSLDYAHVISTGLMGDREFALIDGDGRLLTAREYPALLRVESKIIDDKIYFEFKSNSISVPRKTLNSRERIGTLFGQAAGGLELDNRLQKWFSKCMGVNCHVIEIKELYMRQMESQPYDITYADVAPILLTSEASLKALNNRMTIPVGMNRFRPNLVVSGSSAFAEDDWKNLKIGNCEFEVSHQCPRCVLTTIDPSHPEKGISKEPLKTLSTFRKFGKKITFGVYLIPKKLGILRLNDEVIYEL